MVCSLRLSAYTGRATNGHRFAGLGNGIIVGLDIGGGENEESI